MGGDHDSSQPPFSFATSINCIEKNGENVTQFKIKGCVVNIIHNYLNMVAVYLKNSIT